MSTTTVQAERSTTVSHAYLLVLAATLALVCPNPGPAQDQQAESTTTSATTLLRDPQGLTIIQSAVKALAGPTDITDVTLQASAHYTAGSDEQMGTATLIARGNMESRVLLNLSGGQRLEIRNDFAGAWSGVDGTLYATASQNCFTGASWFFPALTLQAALADTQSVVLYLGTDESKGKPLLHLKVARILPGQPASVSAADTLRMTGIDFYLDPQSFLPLVLAFNTHPDDNAGVDIPVEIQFGDFRDTNGALVPFRIQKYVQGTPTLDLTVTSVSLNSGVADTTFALPTAEGSQQ